MPASVWFDASVLGLLGLLIGSFLNVVIYRFPVMLEAQWRAECAELAGNPLASTEKFNLSVPRSRCPQCRHPIAWFNNLPLVSYVLLKGKCTHCKTAIGLRYPLVELSTGALFFYCGWIWGTTPTALLWSGFCAALLALALIDWDTTLLPDDLTLPLLWSGLVAALLQLTSITLSASVWGAVAGYSSLWLVYWAFKLVTGKDGMGFGDFKLFAALGAWFGWQALVPIILMASVLGAVVGMVLKWSSKLRAGGYVPFGPFLAIAGLTALFFGPQAILRWVGLAL